MKGVTHIGVQAADLWTVSRELGEYEPTEQREDAAGNPSGEDQRRRVRARGNDRRIDEDARSDDAAHDDERRVESVELPREVRTLFGHSGAFRSGRDRTYRTQVFGATVITGYATLVPGQIAILAGACSQLPQSNEPGVCANARSDFSKKTEANGVANDTPCSKTSLNTRGDWEGGSRTVPATTF